ncbi:MAG: hypothetical protein J1F36_05845 [Clostridiales bacterium]|nr:hypothetical protein [Clostridiales bacterium]
MRFIKKLVILTGSSGARGTLMLEKNGYGVWGKLNIFDLPAGEYRFVIISGDDLFVMQIDNKRSRNFELGEIGFEEIHAAIVGSKVVMYGSNCAKKLSSDVIMQRLKGSEKAKRDESNFITFSGRDKKIDDYFKEIAPPQYNDFAIAEKNYYPAYVTLLNDVAATLDIKEAIEVNEQESELIEKLTDAAIEVSPQPPKQDQTPKQQAEQSTEQQPKQAKKQSAEQEPKVKQSSKPVKRQQSKSPKQTEQVAKQPHMDKREREEDIMENKMMPHELELKYLSLIWGATKTAPINEPIKVVQEAKEAPTQEPIKIVQPEVEIAPESSLTTAEKPEVIAMARRITLRDYRVEGAKPTGRRATYFERSSAQLEKLMANNERFTAAEKLIPGSKFVKINYDQKRYYIVGVIGRDYICYGVPSVYSEVPPEPLCGYARWLPFDAGNPHAEGFWMMYQDGVSGETLKS